MRIYLPLLPGDQESMRSGSSLLELEAGRLAWGVAPAARADRPDEDAEDLEYEAVQDAAYWAIQDALGAGDEDRSIAVIAGDAPDQQLVEASEEAGAFGLRLSGSAQLRLASVHVTELTARAAQDDDTDPALLWFDAAEAGAALDRIGS